MTREQNTKILYYILVLENYYLSINNIIQGIFYWYLINIKGLFSALKHHIRLYKLYRKYNFKTDSKFFNYKYMQLKTLI